MLLLFSKTMPYDFRSSGSSAFVFSLFDISGSSSSSLGGRSTADANYLRNATADDANSGVLVHGDLPSHHFRRNIWAIVMAMVIIRTSISESLIFNSLLI